MGENKRRRRRPAVCLQEDLMVEIITRVPAKSLLRFKSVSKQWKSMIGDPTFVTLHHKRAHSRLDGGSLLIIFDPTLGQPLFSAPYEGGAALPLLQNRPELVRSYEASPSSTHGLILLFKRSRFTNRPVFKTRPVIVFNPTTRKLIPLPPLENNVKNLERKNPGDDSRLFVHDCSLGFDPLTGVYKVLSRCTFIRFHSSRYPNWEQIGCYMYYVFTLGTKEWRKLDTPNIPSHELDYYSVCVNGVIYFKADRFYQAHDFIVAFNVGEEKFSLVSPPQAPPLYRQLMEFKGRLALREDTEEKTVVWVLEDHSQDKWTLVELENSLEWIHGGKTYTLVGGVQSSNKVLFAPRDLIMADKHLWVYYYDQSGKEWSKFCITGVRPDINHLCQTTFLMMNNIETLFSTSAHLQ